MTDSVGSDASAETGSLSGPAPAEAAGSAVTASTLDASVVALVSETTGSVGMSVDMIALAGPENFEVERWLDETNRQSRTEALEKESKRVLKDGDKKVVFRWGITGGIKRGQTDR